jgi:hypothetical protein
MDSSTRVVVPPPPLLTLPLLPLELPPLPSTLPTPLPSLRSSADQ